MHVSFLSNHLANLGHQIVPVCSPDTALQQDFLELGLSPRLLKLGGYFHPRGILTLARWLRTAPIDIIHAHYSRDLWTIVPALHISGGAANIPLVFTKHIGTQKPKRDVLHRRIYRRVNYIVAISEVIRKNIILTHPVSPAQVGVIHHGVDLQRFSPDRVEGDSVRAELGLPQASLVFGIVGRLQVGKGYLEFLEMARRISELLPTARFLIVGEPTRGEPEEAELILARIRELQLNRVVKCVGFRQDVPRLLAAMDVFVFPSHAEAFGLVVIEAMAMAKAVISSNCDGVLDIVTDGETGILVPPRDASALTAAALRLAQNPELRQQLGQAALIKARTAFSLQRMLDDVESIYRNLLRPKPA